MSSGRTPLEREPAVCDWCESSVATPVTGSMPDGEGAECLPDAFRRETFQLVKCDQCGLIYLPQRPNKLDLPTYYSSEYCCFESFKDRGIIMYTLAKTLAKMKYRQFCHLMPPEQPVLLDYGCGSGTWIRMLRDVGASWHIIGTDVVDGPIQQLTGDGFEAYVCDDESVSDFIPNGSIGAIHLFHVIEHVPSPKRLLRKLSELLAPGGAIVGQTPNVDCFERRLWKDNWTQWHVPRHFTLFDPDTLKRHAEATELEVMSIRSSLSSATQWAHSFLKYQAKRRGRPFRFTREPLYPTLAVLAVPIGALQLLLGQNTSHMDFVFRKPS